MSVAIDIEKVVKQYGNTTVIDALSLHIRPGEFFTLLGPSGCGKTTLLRMIIGFNSIEGGSIRVNGKVINNMEPGKRNMGMVFQNYAIFPHLSVYDNVAFGLRMRRLPEEEIQERVRQILEIVKIDTLQDRMPVALSGGQQQRVALARAIVIRPEVLLMDEPLSNLDAKLRIEMRNAIKQIQRKVAITTVYVTHDQEEALAVSDRIAVMHGGVIQQIDEPTKLYRRPCNVFVSTFIGLSNLFDGTARIRNGQKEILFDGYDYAVPMTNLSDDVRDGDALIIAVRPEECILSEETGIPAVIESGVFLGLTTHYFVKTIFGKEAEILQSHENRRLIPDGTAIRIAVKPGEINVFRRDTGTTVIQGEPS